MPAFELVQMLHEGLLTVLQVGERAWSLFCEPLVLSPHACELLPYWIVDALVEFDAEPVVEHLDAFDLTLHPEVERILGEFLQKVIVAQNQGIFEACIVYVGMCDEDLGALGEIGSVVSPVDVPDWILLRLDPGIEVDHEVLLFEDG